MGKAAESAGLSCALEAGGVFPQQFGSVGRAEIRRSGFCGPTTDNGTPAMSHRPSWPVIISQMSSSLGPPVVLDTQDVAGGTHKL
jgi:hypothetical protein